MTLQIAVWQIVITLAVLIFYDTFKRGRKRLSKTVERSEPKGGVASPPAPATVPRPLWDD